MPKNGAGSPDRRVHPGLEGRPFPIKQISGLLFFGARPHLRMPLAITRGGCRGSAAKVDDVHDKTPSRSCKSHYCNFCRIALRILFLSGNLSWSFFSTSSPPTQTVNSPIFPVESSSTSIPDSLFTKAATRAAKNRLWSQILQKRIDTFFNGLPYLSFKKYFTPSISRKSES